MPNTPARAPVPSQSQECRPHAGARAAGSDTSREETRATGSRRRGSTGQLQG